MIKNIDWIISAAIFLAFAVMLVNSVEYTRVPLWFNIVVGMLTTFMLFVTIILYQASKEEQQATLKKFMK